MSAGLAGLGGLALGLAAGVAAPVVALRFADIDRRRSLDCVHVGGTKPRRLDVVARRIASAYAVRPSARG
jgi:hypothetical protein